MTCLMDTDASSTSNTVGFETEKPDNIKLALVAVAMYVTSYQSPFDAPELIMVVHDPV